MDSTRATTDMTLSEAKHFVFENRYEGVVCPCCGQFARVYVRRITSAMCRGLIALYQLNRASPVEYIHKNRIGKQLNGGEVAFGGGDFAKLIYWGLIEEKNKDEADKAAGRTSGYWRITEMGNRFVENIAVVPETVSLYSGKIVQISEDRVSIKHALRNKFNYEELMREVVPA
jgi:hypothetical protein